MRRLSWTMPYLALLAALGAVSVEAAGVVPDGNGELVVRYGVWGVVAVLLGASVWTQRVQGESLRRLSIALVRLVETLANRPCLLDDADRLRQMVHDLLEEKNP